MKPLSKPKKLEAGQVWYNTANCTYWLLVSDVVTSDFRFVSLNSKSIHGKFRTSASTSWIAEHDFVMNSLEFMGTLPDFDEIFE